MPDHFFKPYKTWLSEYFNEKPEKSHVIFDLEYFNSATTKVIFDLLILMKEAINKGNKINVIWRYDEDDEELFNAGNELKDFIGIPIQMECKKIDAA